ncbi:MAG TPA: 5'-methylthioadenosine/S-adenosylhomocysteine nucleosidase [Spirochaetota bacterium]|nr:5'-methylthioadenosine/S-adenosylhomocysteine nucleosidase [Spirochaetota bacterium]
MKKIALIVAVKTEARELLADSFWGWEKKEPMHYCSSRFPVTLTISGIGKVFATYAMSQAANGADTVLSVGTSGGLGKQRVGDLYICHEFVEHDIDLTHLGIPFGVTPYDAMDSPVISPETDKLLEERVIAAIDELGLTHNFGRSMSGDQFITDKEIIGHKIETFSADLTDMESSACAKLAAYRIKIPFFALRYVSDNADHNASVSWTEEVKKAAVILNDVLKLAVNSMDC